MGLNIKNPVSVLRNLVYGYLYNSAGVPLGLKGGTFGVVNDGLDDQWYLPPVELDKETGQLISWYPDGENPYHPQNYEAVLELIQNDPDNPDRKHTSFVYGWRQSLVAAPSCAAQVDLQISFASRHNEFSSFDGGRTSSHVDYALRLETLDEEQAHPLHTFFLQWVFRPMQRTGERKIHIFLEPLYGESDTAVGTGFIIESPPSGRLSDYLDLSLGDSEGSDGFAYMDRQVGGISVVDSSDVSAYEDKGPEEHLETLIFTRFRNFSGA